MKSKPTTNKNGPAPFFSIDNISKIIASLATVLTIFSSIMWWKSDNENKKLDVQLKRAELKLKDLDFRIKESGIGEAELKNAQLKPSFSVQYLVFGGAVYESIKNGNLNKFTSDFGAIRKTKEAKAAFESLYEFPLLETNLREHSDYNKLDKFIEKYSPQPLRKRTHDEKFDSALFTVVSIACFGGTTAKDVELVYEERFLPNEPFIFPPNGLRYGDNSPTYKPGAPIKSENLNYIRKNKVMKLGNIQPGHGRLIPIELSAHPVFTHKGEDNYVTRFVAISSFHLKPIIIRYKTLTGEVLEQPIREQLGIPMPMTDFIDIRG